MRIIIVSSKDDTNNKPKSGWTNAYRSIALCDTILFPHNYLIQTKISIIMLCTILVFFTGVRGYVSQEIVDILKTNFIEKVVEIAICI